MKRPVQKMVSILGDGYLQPVADLVEKTLKWPATKRNAVQALHYDNIYAVSIILLLVATVESYVTRLRYFKGSEGKKKKASVPRYLKLVFSDFRHEKALTEVFVVRDAIFHNHLWEIDFTWRPMTLENAELVPHREDKKYTNRVSIDTRRTKALRLHVVPTRVDRRDAVKVFDTVWNTLLFLENKDRNYCYVSHRHVAFRKKVRPVTEVRDALAAEL